MTQLAVLRDDPSFIILQSQIKDIASKLEELGNVPMVAAQMELIMELQTDEYWQGISLPVLENLRKRLRSLVKLIEPAERKIALLR